MFFDLLISCLKLAPESSPRDYNKNKNMLTDAKNWF